MDSQSSDETDDLAIGLYDHLLTLAMDESLRARIDPRLYFLAEVDAEDAHDILAQYLEHLLSAVFAQFRGATALQRQRRLFEKLIAVLADEIKSERPQNYDLADPLSRLLAIYSELPKTHPERPDTPLARTTLLTGTRLDPSLASQLRKEVLTADRVDILS